MWCCLLLRPTVSRTEGTAERGLFKTVWFLRAQQSKHVLLKSYHRSKTWVLFSVAETQRSVSAASDVWADIQCRIQTECKSSGWFTNAPHCLSLQKSLFFSVTAGTHWTRYHAESFSPVGFPLLFCHRAENMEAVRQQMSLGQCFPSQPQSSVAPPECSSQVFFSQSVAVPQLHLIFF